MRKCGNCVNLYTWDCPRPETSCNNKDVCSCYKKIEQDDDYGIDWSEYDAWCPTCEEVE